MISKSGVTPPTAQRFGSPEAYTPKHLAEKIPTSKSALEGERRQVTVLFADLNGSMELTRRLPAIYGLNEHVEAGGLMAYAPSVADNYRRAGIYVGKILRGAKPADLPVEQPMKFELIINMETAKALGLTIPPSVLVRADQIIE